MPIAGHADLQRDGIIESKSEKVVSELAVKEHAERPLSGPAKRSYGSAVRLAEVDVSELVPRGGLAQKGSVLGMQIDVVDGDGLLPASDASTLAT